jgi:hypothetical protein
VHNWANLYQSFNSAIFSTVATIDYPIIATNEVFGNDHTTNLTIDYAHSMALWTASGASSGVMNFVPLTRTPLISTMQESAINKIGPWTVDVLSPLDCIEQYSQNYMSSRGVLVLRLQASGTNSRVLNTYMHTSDANSWLYKTPENYSWMCNQLNFSADAIPTLALSCTANMDLLRSEVQLHGWRPIPGRNETVESCISEKIDERCRLEFSKHIAILVLCLNFAKMVLMFIVAFDIGERPIITVGDAIASFLTRPDETTRGLSLWNNFDFRYERAVQSRWAPEPRMCESISKRRRRLYTGASYGTIVICLSM